MARYRYRLPCQQELALAFECGSSEKDVLRAVKSAKVRDL